MINNHFTPENIAVSRVRGKRYNCIIGEVRYPIVATWHPAYILRQPAKEIDMVGDMQLAQTVLETLTPGRTVAKKVTIW